MANKPIEGVSAAGRLPPPDATRFKKGKSGNARGRPKGIDTKQLTRKFARHKQIITIDGKAVRLSRLEIAIRKTQALAATGKSSAAALLNGLRVLIASDGGKLGGWLVLPDQEGPKEFLERVQAENIGKIEPGTALNVEAEAFGKAVRGEPTRYGEALLAFHRKYH